MALLQIEDLRTEIQLKNGVVHAVDGVSLHVDEGETLGIVGESGCGKTMTALSIMDLLPNGDDYINDTQSHDRQVALFFATSSRPRSPTTLRAAR